MFENIIGNEPTLRRLRQAVDNPSHAYAIVGEAGLGKLAIAKSFAQALQCETNSACGECLSCRMVKSGNHPDIIYVKATKTKTIGVEDVRTQLILPMSEKPFRHRYKIFIVDQPPTPQAQNALLKTIEEPAYFGIFLFLAETTRAFLPTILSRCVTLKLQALTDAEIIQTLSQIMPNPPSPAILMVAAGNPGRAKKLVASPDFENMLNLAKSVADNVATMSMVEIFGLHTKFDKWKDNIQTLLDLLYFSCLENVRNHQNISQISQISQIEAITAAKKALHYNGNFQMTIETMLLKMR
ncbi:MAG: hypothetical protein FWG68_00240 [Defluviitaleaceae bacterium]|nr:hypothetical protein [Defluviitaleaceae bacterium]